MSIASKLITEGHKGPKNIITYENIADTTPYLVVKLENGLKIIITVATGGEQKYETTPPAYGYRYMTANAKWKAIPNVRVI